jgi:DNA-binding CsgD family transcriptional regulator
MGRKEFDSNQNFEDIWGEDVQNSSGFTMVPNDLLQNLGALNLTPAQKIVLIEIISLGSYGISAQRMGERTGLSADTVRDAWRQLRRYGHSRTGTLFAL